MGTTKSGIKRLLAVMLSLAMVFSLVGANIFSASAVTSGDYEYKALDNGTVEIIKYNGSATELTIPSTLDGKTVTRIGNYAFEYCGSLKSITIGNGVESIGDEVFYSCTSLTSVVIPNSVKSIGSDIFNSCTSLTSIVIPDGVNSIGNSAFAGCTSLASIVIPDTVVSIGNEAFYNCNSLTTVIYGGTKEQWKLIAIGTDNKCLTGVKKTFCQHTDIVIDKAVSATCENTGLTEGSHCKDCYKTNKAQTILKALGHSTTVKNQKSATYFANGYSGDTVCTVCNKTITNGKAVAKKTLKAPKVKVTKGKKQFKVKYTKVSGATGFQVQYKKGKKTITKTYSTKKSATKVIKKLKSGTYKVKVRALVQSGKNKAYSAWTKTKTIKI